MLYNYHYYRHRLIINLYRTPTSTADDSPVSKVSQTPRPFWTPGAWSGYGDDSYSDDVNEEKPVIPDSLQALNDAIHRLSELTSQRPPNPLLNQVELNWEEIPLEEREKCINYAATSCKVVCEIIAPNAADALYNSLPQEKPVSQDLITLMKAYSSAPTRNLKLQILSIYAYDYPVRELQALHEPYSKLS